MSVEPETSSITSCRVNYHWRKPRFVLSIFEPISCVLLANIFIIRASQIIKKANWISGKFLYRDILVKMENKKGCWLKICTCLKLTLALQCLETKSLALFSNTALWSTCWNVHCKAAGCLLTGIFISFYKHDRNIPFLSHKQQENVQYWV